MRKIWGIFLAAAVLLSGCKRYDPVETTETPPPVVVQEESTGSGTLETEQETEGTAAPEPVEVTTAEEPEPPERRPVKVKGIYLSAHVAGNEEKMQEMIQKIDETEINAVVIDVKDDNGRITFQMDQPLVEETGAVEAFIPDIQGLMDTLKEHNIYTIARVVSFRDPYLAEKKPELALKLADGSLYRDKKGMAWVNPYKQEMWDYLVDVGIQAHQVGFDEIQFDYIRFSTDAGMSKVDFGEDALEQDKEDVITEFTIYAAQELHDMGVPLSADVYGVIIDSKLDASIVGQNYYEMAKHLDYISPMVYPSHYGPGNLGLAVPDAQPYETIFRSMKTSRKVLAGMGREAEDMQVSGNDVSGNSISGNSISENSTSGKSMDAADPKELVPNQEIRADVRPWLQDFTATWVKGHIRYGPEEIRAQIQAGYDAGYEEWILWNASNRYTEGGLLPEEMDS